MYAGVCAASTKPTTKNILPMGSIGNLTRVHTCSFARTLTLNITVLWSTGRALTLLLVAQPTPGKLQTLSLSLSAETPRSACSAAALAQADSLFAPPS